MNRARTELSICTCTIRKLPVPAAIQYFVRLADSPGILSDRYDFPVRYYYYNANDDTLGYSRGVEDLSKIIYTPGKAVYDFSYFKADTKTNYTVVIYITDSRRLTATFLPYGSGGESDNLSYIEIQDYENGRKTNYTAYYFDENLLSLAKSQSLSANSSYDDLMNFIKTNNPDPLMVSENKFHKDTKVVVEQSLTSPDQSGAMQTYTQKYDITEKDGYYIQKAAASE